MNRNKMHLFICLAAILMIAANTDIKSTVIPHINSENIVDICDSITKQRVIFFVVIDKIQKADSLFGFDLEIKYDTTKLKILNYVNGNTLSEFFDINFNYGPNGKISGYGMVHNISSPPSFGDSLLIGFRAEWLSNCPDTSEIQIEDLNFTSEFKINYDSLGSGDVVAQKKKSYSIEFDFDKNEEMYKYGDSIIETTMLIKVPGQKNAEYISYHYNLIDTLRLIESQVINYNNISVTVDTNINSVNINDLENINGDLVIYSKFKIIKSQELTGKTLKVVNLSMSECSCIDKFISDSLSFNNDTTDVSENDKINDYTIIQNNEYIIIKNSSKINEILIYDYLGRVVDKIYPVNSDIIEICMNNYNTGLYYLVLINNNKIEIKNIYKNYSN